MSQQNPGNYSFHETPSDIEVFMALYKQYPPESGRPTMGLEVWAVKALYELIEELQGKRVIKE